MCETQSKPVIRTSLVQTSSNRGLDYTDCVERWFRRPIGEAGGQNALLFILDEGEGGGQNALLFILDEGGGKRPLLDEGGGKHPLLLI